MPTKDSRKIRVLFLCTGNSARSQMAEGFLRNIGHDRFEVYSAGNALHPIHPLAVAAMRDMGIDITMQTVNHVDEYVDMSFDFIISLCDKAFEECPRFPGDPMKIAWNFEDPVPSGDPRVFNRVGREINERIKMFALVQSKPLTGR